VRAATGPHVKNVKNFLKAWIAANLRYEVRAAEGVRIHGLLAGGRVGTSENFRVSDNLGAIPPTHSIETAIASCPVPNLGTAQTGACFERRLPELDAKQIGVH
jgi:hypothetical protein